MGTPHQGSNSADLLELVGTLVNVFSPTGPAIRTDIAKKLARDAKRLQDLAISARRRLEHLQVVSFYETERTFPFSTPVSGCFPILAPETSTHMDAQIVGRESSILEIPDESINGLAANHRDISKFAGETSDYRSVLNSIKRIARNHRTVAQAETQEAPRVKTPEAPRVETPSSQRCKYQLPLLTLDKKKP
jgi:ankyrin repeat domain-containing protein 50